MGIKPQIATIQQEIEKLLLFLEEQLLNLLLDGSDLRFDLRALILSHAGSNDWPTNPTGSAQGLLGPDKHVGHVLILAQEGDVKENFQRLTVSGEDDKLSLTPVEGLGGLIGSLPQLLVVSGLLNQVQDLGGESLLSQGVGLGVNLVSHGVDGRVVGLGD